MRMVAHIAIAAVLMLSGGMPALAADDLDTLNRQVVQLYRQGKHGEALAIAEKALALAERTLGPSHPNTLRSVNNLAALRHRSIRQTLPLTSRSASSPS
jgi:hypothetical protein